MSLTTTLPLTQTKSHKKSKEKSKHKDKEKKRKEAPTQEDAGLERAKKKSKSAKGKERASSSSVGEFVGATSSLDLSLPPYYTNSPLSGAISVLDGLVMRYVPSLNGVLLSHSNARFSQRTALVQPETPFMKCTITFDCVVWSPRIGMKLVGYHSISSPSHMSLLVHRTFNVSIPTSHIPQLQEGREDGSTGEETFQFVFGAAKTAQEEDQEMVDGEGDVIDYALPEEEKGNWVSSWTGHPISGSDGSRSVEFTVIGLTIANSMLSLIGSLQPDPFDSRHSLSASEALATHPVYRRMEAEQEADDIEEVDRELSVHLEPTSEEPEDEIQEEWTQDIQKKRKSPSPGPLTSPPPPELEAETEPEKSEAPAAVAKEKDAPTKKRKRKHKDREADKANGGDDVPTVEAGDKPPKKKKKKKSEVGKEEGAAEGAAKDAMAIDGMEPGQDGTEKKRKKRKNLKKREVAAETA